MVPDSTFFVLTKHSKYFCFSVFLSRVVSFLANISAKG